MKPTEIGSRLLLAITIAAATARCYAGAGIATDGSVGARVTVSGANAGAGNYLIPQTLGSLSGNNLFHSFSTFNIDTGQSATFTTTTNSIINVISRVTGGTPSQLNGTLALQPAAGTPAFFFINPAGVVFGAGAAIDVPGAFHVGTSDYVKFANGDKFHADLAKTSTLSSAAPEAFGFLGTASATIAVKDDALLATRPSQPIGIVAGAIEIDNGSVATQGGDIRVVALGQAAQEIGFTAPPAAASGDLTISNGGSIASATLGASNGGAIAVSAGNITIDGQSSSRDTGIINDAKAGTTGHAGGIAVAATGSIALFDGGVIASGSYAAGRAGIVKVDAGAIAIDGRGNNSFATGIYSQAESGSGDAGGVEVAVTGTLSIANGGAISSSTFSAGNAGTVKVGAGAIAIDGQKSSFVTGIFSDTNSASTGHAGSVEVLATGHLSIVNGGVISSDTFTSGNAGTVRVDAGSITVDGQGSGSVTGILSQADYGTGNAGGVEVAVTGRLSLFDGGVISSGTYASGNAGTVKIGAGSIVIDRQGGNDSTGIYSQADSGTGNAGSVEVTATGSITVTDGGAISSSTFSSGNAGTVKVYAGSIAIDGWGGLTGIFSDAKSGSTGHAGGVEVAAAGSLSLVDGGVISSDTYAAGNAGTVKVAAGSIAIDRQGSSTVTGILSQANYGTGNAGGVEVSAAGSLSLANGGIISSGTYAMGNAGTVKVAADSIAIDGMGTSFATGVFSQADSGTGNAGSVEVSAAGNLSLVNGGAISSSTSSAGDAGTVKVGADSIAIDGQRNSRVGTGIFSDANRFSTGHAGGVEVTATGSLSLREGGVITSATYASGNAGTVKVHAYDIAIDGLGSETGIISNAKSGSTGHAGNVEVSATGHLSIVDAGLISSDTFASGNAGTVKISAGSISIDGWGSETGIVSDAKSGSTGHAGGVEVSATGSISIVAGGLISSDTFSSGDAGTVKVSAGSISIDGWGSDAVTGILSQADHGTGNAGGVEVTVAGNLSLTYGGVISSGTYASGNAGTVKVGAGSITIDGQGYSSSGTGIFSQAELGSTGHAGNVEVSASGTLSIADGGAISSSTRSWGNAGTVKVDAGSMVIDGTGYSSRTTGILSQAELDSAGHAGDVAVSVKDSLSIVAGGVISSDTFATGNAGTVKVSAGSIAIDGQDNDTTGIFSTTKTDYGNAGSVEVTAAGNIGIVNGGMISTSTATSGNAGSVKVSADSIAIDGQGSGTTTGILSDAQSGSTGHAGGVEVTVQGQLYVTDGGYISSDTYGSGDAGTIKVTAGSITIDGQGNYFTGITSDATASTGNAGNVEVTAKNSLSIVDYGIISSSTYTSGNAGSVKVSAGTIAIDAPIDDLTLTGIISLAVPGSLGNAGNVEVTTSGNLSIKRGLINSDTFSVGHAGSIAVRVAGTLSLSDYGTISSNTYMSGHAGTIQVSAGSLLVDGASSAISAAAAEGSSGQTGDVSVAANDITLANGGRISIENNATVSDSSALIPSSISVTAPHITIRDSANAITTSSTGNVAAGSIRIDARDLLHLDPSGITTTSNQGNGGAIDITAGTLWLDQSRITTSVTGLAGNGGDISIAADSLIMNTGFIQANTAAANASGGLVSIAARNLIPSGNTIFLGGDTPHAYQPDVFGFNVIQAAAPTGISGVVQVSAPTLDVSASLVGLNTGMLHDDQLARHPCENTGGSSLVSVGHGGLPLTGADFLSPGQIPGPASISAPSPMTDTINPTLNFTGCRSAFRPTCRAEGRPTTGDSRFRVDNGTRTGAVKPCQVPL